MKRHHALQPLSRDHHVALVAAQRLRKAGDGAQARDAFLEFWHEHGARHFRVEEDVLLPVAAGWIDPGAEPVVRMLVEHVRIRAAALRLERDPDPALAPLHELGTLLQQHVRLEEREVFPLIEAAMPEAEAERLAALVMQAEGEGSPPAGR